MLFAGQMRDERVVWATTINCEWGLALAINLASAGERSGCKLVSGSFRTRSVGGRGVSSAAVNKR
jgi:hypothetical protein